MNPEIAETTGISDIGSSLAEDFSLSFVIRIIDFDSFFDFVSLRTVSNTLPICTSPFPRGSSP